MRNPFHPTIWRIVMTSLNFVKGLRPLMLASAALLFHTGAAWAADAQGDAQMQARELLGGKTPSRTVLSAARRERAASIPGVDAQEQARQMILGAQHFDKTHAAVRIASTSGVADKGQRSAQNNTQQLAQRMILGQKY
jgi:hypothetical protein